MKKILAMLLALVMVLGLAACGGGSDNNKAPDADKPADATPDDGAANDAPAEPALDPVTLRVWFHGSTVSPEASAKVMESVKAYLQDKIKVTLEQK